MYYVYNPIGFDPTTIIPDSHLEDYIRLFLHIVIATQCKYQADENDYVPLHARTLRKQIHRGCTEAIREALIHKKVIECDKKYYPEEKCYGFRLHDDWRNKKIERLPINLTTRRMNLLIREGFLNGVPDLPMKVHESIWHWLNQTEVDYEAACLYLDKQTDKEENLTQKWYCLEKLRAKDWFFHVDEQGRVYHNIACLWSQFRPFLSIGKQKLVNIDIRNSQPLFFAIKLRELYNPYHHPLYYSGAQTSRRMLADDVKLYIELVEQGNLYEYLMDQWGYTNRKLFKKKFFALFYSKPNTDRKLNKEFQHLFPNVFDVICDLKKENYKALPIEMQRIEASLMIGEVGSRLAEAKVPFLTIHDSIMTTPEHIDLVRSYIREAFDGLGLSPTIT